MRPLLIGRFQPFHNGHMWLARKIINEYGSLIIGIGSAQESHTLANPFTAGERQYMIQRAMESNSIHDYYLVPIEDLYRNSLWVSHILSLTPPFDIAISGNPLVKRLFHEAGKNVLEPEMKSRESYSGREIRKKIIAGEKWDDLVPDAVYKTIIEIDGVRRLQDLSKTDEVNR
ncbi:MAG: nicotinamide-nucleotide adenylyltransferase [Candidatus Thermoplasmatota archaeon]|nr:nicotinamide-nucleotide adenylyltransferase [Candidatus Thermoplasmatota archaeon]MCL5788935.1 nicotinamide-nucleotide adenylyltransferase [Candidatus Thermoplasmatota archaeon]